MDERPHNQTTHHVRAALDGDMKEMAWLVERFTPLLLVQARSRLRRHLRHVVDPEDLVQEVWAVALRRWEDLSPRGRATPAVLKFLSTTLVNLYRRLQARHLQGKPLREGDSSGVLRGLPDDTLGIVTHAVQREQQGAVQKAIDSLPELDREIVVLRGIEQVENNTAAAILGEKPNTVSRRFQRALARLEQVLPHTVIEDLGG